VWRLLEGRHTKRLDWWNSFAGESAYAEKAYFCVNRRARATSHVAEPHVAGHVLHRLDEQPERGRWLWRVTRVRSLDLASICLSGWLSTMCSFTAAMSNRQIGRDRSETLKVRLIRLLMMHMYAARKSYTVLWKYLVHQEHHMFNRNPAALQSVFESTIQLDNSKYSLLKRW
jgi:hypothetical protein